MLLTGRPVSVKLPSKKLQVSKPFEVTSDSVVNFVYDITVVKLGKVANTSSNHKWGRVGPTGDSKKLTGKAKAGCAKTMVLRSPPPRKEPFPGNFQSTKPHKS